MDPSSPRSDVPVPVADPGIRFRLVYALWKNAADWQTRGSILRATVITLWRRASSPPR